MPPGSIFVSLSSRAATRRQQFPAGGEEDHRQKGQHPHILFYQIPTLFLSCISILPHFPGPRPLPHLIHIQLGPVLDQGHGVVQAPVPGEVGADGVPHDVGQLVVRPVEEGGVIDQISGRSDLCRTESCG